MDQENQNNVKTLNSKMKTGLKWNIVNQIATQFIFIWFSIYLARLLGPEAYGLVGMITVLSGFASIFVDFGFASSVIYYQIKTDYQLSSIFWFNLFIGIFIYSVFFILAPFISDFYNEPQLTLLTRVICVGIIISALSSLQGVLLSKEINFKKKVIIQWCSTILSYCVGFLLAFKGFGVWSIVFMSLTSSAVGSLILWSTSSWKPSFYFSFAELKPLIKYSTSVGTNSIFSYFTRNVDNLLIAKFAGEGALGLYTNAYRLMMLPVSNIAGIFSGVLFSGFSKMGNDKKKIGAIYLKTISLISFITFPLMVGVFSIAKELVLVFYGSAWAGAIPLIKILSLLGALQSILFLNGTIFNALGKPKIGLYATIILYIFLLPAWIIGLKIDGIIGFTKAYLFVSGCGSIIILYNAIRLIDVSLMQVFHIIKKQLIGALFMGFIILLLNYFPLSALNIRLKLAIQIFVGIVTYITYSLVFQKDLILLLKNFKKNV